MSCIICMKDSIYVMRGSICKSCEESVNKKMKRAEEGRIISEELGFFNPFENLGKFVRKRKKRKSFEID